MFLPARYTTTKSLLLNGTTQYVNIGNIAALDFTGAAAFSITAWVKLTALTVGNTIMSKIAGSTGTFNGWIIYTGGSGRLRFLLGGPSGIIFCFCNAGLSTGVWYHVAITYSGSGTAAGVNFYINGTVQAKTVTTDTYSASAANSTPVLIGVRGDNTLWMPGNLFAVTPWSTALSGANVTALYNGGVPIDARLNAEAASIIAYYRCGNDPIDDATGTTGVIMDRVGGYKGTPIATVSGSIVTDAP